MKPRFLRQLRKLFLITEFRSTTRQKQSGDAESFQPQPDHAIATSAMGRGNNPRHSKTNLLKMKISPIICEVSRGWFVTNDLYEK